MGRQNPKNPGQQPDRACARLGAGGYVQTTHLQVGRGVNGSAPSIRMIISMLLGPG